MIFVNNYAKGPDDLDWGNFSPEGYSADKKNALLIFNIDLSTQQNVEHAIIYLIGKLQYGHKHLPKGATVKAVLDMRGQSTLAQQNATYVTTTVSKRIPVTFEIRTT